MQQHGSKYFAHRPLSLHTTLRVGSKGQIQLSHHGHVAYQIKGNQVCSNMVANILPIAPTSPCPWVKVSHSTFSEHGYVAYQVKGIENAATWPSIPPTLGWGQKAQFKFFKHFDLPHTPCISIRLKSDIDIVTNQIRF